MESAGHRTNNGRKRGATRAGGKKVPVLAKGVTAGETAQCSNDDLLSWWVRVPTKSESALYWWVKVIEQQGKFIYVGGNKSAGKPWWTHVDKITVQRRPRKGVTAGETESAQP